MIRAPAGAFVLVVHGEPLYPGDDGIVFVLGHVEHGHLFVAPLGAPPFADEALRSTWVLVGDTGSLPDNYQLGWDIAGAYRRHVAAHN